MSAHTPGPWLFSPELGWVLTDSGRYGVPGEMHIADVRGWGYLTGSGESAHMSDHEAMAVQERNGRLLAAAPDLLAAAKHALDTLGNQGGCEVIRDAIAKAEGR